MMTGPRIKATHPRDTLRRGTGIVYIAEEVESDADGGWRATGRYAGHWETGVEGAHKMLEWGPGWTDASDAIRWGRERAPLVLIRVGDPPRTYYSAGDRDPEDTQMPRWPTDSPGEG